MNYYLINKETGGKIMEDKQISKLISIRDSRTDKELLDIVGANDLPKDLKGLQTKLGGVE